MPVADPVHAIVHPTHGALAVEPHSELLHLLRHGTMSSVCSLSGLEQGDHVVAVAQVGGQLQLTPGEVIEGVERHVGHDLTGARADGDAAVAAVHCDVLP